MGVRLLELGPCKSEAIGGVTLQQDRRAAVRRAMCAREGGGACRERGGTRVTDKVEETWD